MKSEVEQAIILRRRWMQAMGFNESEIVIACDDPDINPESERRQIAAMNDILILNSKKGWFVDDPKTKNSTSDLVSSFGNR